MSKMITMLSTTQTPASNLRPPQRKLHHLSIALTLFPLFQPREQERWERGIYFGVMICNKNTEYSSLKSYILLKAQGIQWRVFILFLCIIFMCSHVVISFKSKFNQRDKPTGKKIKYQQLPNDQTNFKRLPIISCILLRT